jgi:multidrug efflux pump subunit AcrA (membrane-fusion protein)
LFAGFFGEEFRTMLRKRRLRAALLAAGLVGASCIPISDRVGGPFKVRPVTRAEVRAPVAGFLRAVEVDEGQRVEAGAVLARMEIPDLASQIARKQAELRESQANLRRLEAGPRAEEVAEQRERVHRATAWRDLAQRDLERTRQSFRAELARLDLQIDRARSEFEYVSTICTQAEQLYQQGGLAGQQYLAEKKRKTAAHSEWQQLEAAKRAREAEGPLQAEAELAKREKELADTQATLDLMQAGTRPEEIEAERARLLRLQEEDHFLHEQESKAVITAPVAGMVTTPRLAEKIGTYLEKGIVICLVEDLSNLEAEIAVAEQDASKLTAGEPVTLKARALPFHTLTAAVDRIAPATVTAERAVQGTVTVYCRLHNDDGLLRSGMTGFGRIYHHVRPVGLILASRGLRYVRTEFWW